MHGLNLPNLTAGNHTITSPQTPQYNCVSHAVYEDLVSLWPDDDNRWPESVSRVETVDAFVELFSALGFEPFTSMQQALPGIREGCNFCGR